MGRNNCKWKAWLCFEQNRDFPPLMDFSSVIQLYLNSLLNSQGHDEVYSLLFPKHSLFYKYVQYIKAADRKMVPLKRISMCIYKDCSHMKKKEYLVWKARGKIVPLVFQHDPRGTLRPSLDHTQGYVSAGHLKNYWVRSFVRKETILELKIISW